MALPQGMMGDCRAFNFSHKYFNTATHIVHPTSPCFLHHSHVLYISFVLCSHYWVVRILHFHCRDPLSIKRLAPLQRPQSNELHSGFVMFKRFAIWKLLGQILTKWSQDDLCFHFFVPHSLGENEFNDLQGLTGLCRCSGELLWFRASFPAVHCFTSSWLRSDWTAAGWKDGRTKSRIGMFLLLILHGQRGHWRSI